MHLRYLSALGRPIVWLWRNTALAANVVLLLACSGSNHNTITKLPTVPDAVSVVLYAAPHGLSPYSGTDPAFLDLMKARPDVAAREVAHQITLEQVAEAVEKRGWEMVLAFERAVELLGYLASAEGDRVLTSWYIGLQAHRATSEGQRAQEFERLSYQVLNNLNTRYAQPIVDSILGRWYEMSSNERRLTLIYVAEVSHGRRDIANRLRSMSRDGMPDRDLLERAISYIESP